ncbi:MAG TPA: FliH/SctL family protein [Alphaproteobacteria bacterium]|nr:FliH/SctL family protein [Alphaproteobacteria bacterium]
MNKSKKFLFDLNNFDQPEEEEIVIEEEEIEVEPPPPTFSEDELEASKAIAHAAGRNEGILEERGKREQFIANVLKQISENFSSLFAAEMYRERQYEEESLRLALEIIELLAPSLTQRLGEEALKHSLKEVLKTQSEQSEIRIEVHPETASEIDAVIATIWPDKDSAPRYKVVADSELEKGACHLSWKDGGMVRNPKKIANDIKTAIESLLVEQVMSKTNSPLTNIENNAINNKQSGESVPETSDMDQNGDAND